MTIAISQSRSCYPKIATSRDNLRARSSGQIEEGKRKGARTEKPAPLGYWLTRDGVFRLPRGRDAGACPALRPVQLPSSKVSTPLTMIER